MTNKEDIKAALVDAGLRHGDHLFVHSSLKKIGPMDGGADALIDAMLEVVGHEGTLAMPSFNYTHPLPDPYFDVATTPGRTGVLTEVFRKRPGTLRSLHPTHSVIAQGARAAEFLAGHLATEAFGVGSPIDRIAQAGGYVMLIGVTQVANSTIHVAEAHAGVKKFFWAPGPLPITKMLMPDGSVIEHHLDCSASCDTAYPAIEYPLRQADKVIDLHIGSGVTYLMKGKDIIDVVVKMIAEKPDILFCRAPQCRCCSKGREYLRQTGVLENTVP